LPRLVNAGRMESNLGRLDKPYLFESVVKDFELLHRQVSIHFDNDASHSDTSSRASDHVDH
jgi:hypothetical protein